MNDNWIAQAVRTHVLDGPSQSELARSDIERCQRETIRRLEAALLEADSYERTSRKSAAAPSASRLHDAEPQG